MKYGVLYNKYNINIGDDIQAYATAIGLFNSLINVVLLIIANTTSKKFSENSLW